MAKKKLARRKAVRRTAAKDTGLVRVAGVIIAVGSKRQTLTVDQVSQLTHELGVLQGALSGCCGSASMRVSVSAT